LGAAAGAALTHYAVCAGRDQAAQALEILFDPYLAAQ